MDRFNICLSTPIVDNSIGLSLWWLWYARIQNLHEGGTQKEQEKGRIPFVCVLLHLVSATAEEEVGSECLQSVRDLYYGRRINGCLFPPTDCTNLLL